MLAVINSSEDVSSFVGYIKQETSAMINRICGVRQNTIWTDSFDNVTILTPDKVIDRIKYIYKNPAKAHLVRSIGDYPGVSSWNMFRSGIHKARHLWLKRSGFYQINNLHALSESAQSKIITKMAGDNPNYHTFELEPDAWMDSFPEFNHINREVFNQNFIKEILTEEREIAHENGVMGRERLKIQPINKEFKSKKYGKKMFCMSSNIELRVRYITLFKSVSRQAYEAYKLIKQGICNVMFPPGTMLPGGRILQELSKMQFYEDLGVCYT
jgi:hypothetical protein